MKPLFVMYDNGIAEIDVPRLRELAKQHDAMLPFYARAILELDAMLTQGQLKGRQPDDLIVTLRD